MFFDGEKEKEVWTDGSVMNGAFGGAAFTYKQPGESEPLWLGEAWVVRRCMGDVRATELRAIQGALGFLVDSARTELAQAGEDQFNVPFSVNIVTDCHDAILERYLYLADNSPDAMTGWVTEVTHKELLQEIEITRAVLWELRVYTDTVWQQRDESQGNMVADRKAWKRAWHARKFAGSRLQTDEDHFRDEPFHIASARAE